MPDANQLGDCGLLSSKKLNNFQNVQNRPKIIFSLGYDNLTLLQDSLLFVSDSRIDGIMSGDGVGELV